MLKGAVVQALAAAGSLVAVWCSALPAGAQGAPAAVADVTAQTRTYFDALRRNDVAGLEAILAADYVEVSPLGVIESRAQVIGFYRIASRAQTVGASELTAVSVDDLQVRVYDDMAVAIAGSTFTMTVAGHPVPRLARVTLVWRRAGGVWQLVSSHHTTIRPPGPAIP